MKMCSVCERQLPLESFDKQSTGKLGRRADCKKCRKRFVQSPEGLVKSIYNQQIIKSRKRGHTPPRYSEQELFNWFWSQTNAQILYDDWVIRDYPTELRPSVDRLNDYKPYEFGNIQLMTWDENNKKQYSDRINGINTKSCSTVNQYDLNDNFIQSFYSYSEAARQVNGLPANIRNVAEAKPIFRKEKDGSIRSWTPTKAYGFGWKKP